jgi:hypothetical protein
MTAKFLFGNTYTKTQISEALSEPQIANVREGIHFSTTEKICLLFVDLEKDGKEKRFHFNNYFEGDFFHWDTQTTKHINSPSVKRITDFEVVPHLFCRVRPKLKSKTLPYIYCGELEYQFFEKGTAYPSHLIFQSTDFDELTGSEELIEIYAWRPATAGQKSSTKIDLSKIISKKRKASYKKPTETERKGLVTSRVGQGYYRQEILTKWGNTCPLTACCVKEILISSHIVSWAESSDDERLDPENGILLSPNADALFDKHLISFNDDGTLLVSRLINPAILEGLGLVLDAIIVVSDEMKKYLKRHRAKLKIKEI